MNWAEFFAMGGKGFYVWGAYLVTLLVVGIEVVSVLARRRRTLAVIREEIDAARDTRMEAGN